jgi:hypothetical protein
MVATNYDHRAVLDNRCVLTIRLCAGAFVRRAIIALPSFGTEPGTLLSGEGSIIEALRGFTKLADGKFPKSIVDWGDWSVFLSQSGASQEETAAIAANSAVPLHNVEGRLSVSGRWEDDKR